MRAVLGSFEFPQLSGEEMLGQGVVKMKRIHSLSSLALAREDAPPAFPDSGCSESELSALERDLGLSVPGSFRSMLSKFRYLALDDQKMVFGIHLPGEVSYGAPWLSGQHQKDKKWLVVGNYWRYADGDDLLMDPETGQVFAYLHEYKGKIEWFADSIQAAVFRMVNEVSDEEYQELYEFDDEI